MAELVDLIKDLVKFKTVEGNEQEKNKIIDYVEDYFKDSGFVVKRHNSNGIESIVVLTEDTKKPTVMIQGHLDVVPALDEAFDAKLIDKHNLYGRGTCDMKGQVAVMMIVMKHFSPGQKPSVGLMLTTDEEIGGDNGAGFLILKENYSSKIAISPDCISDFDIVEKEKGIINLKITAKGKSAHGSTPWEGENAIEILMDVYNSIKQVLPETTEQERWKPTVMIGKMQGGQAVNIVPGSAEMFLNIRYTENDSPEDIVSQVKSMSDKITLEVLHDSKPMSVDVNNPYILKAKGLIEKRVKKKVEFLREHGAGDARFFTEKNIPVIVFGPKGAGYHGDDEYVDVNSLEKMKEVMIEFIESL